MINDNSVSENKRTLTKFNNNSKYIKYIIVIGKNLIQNL